jgi:hypothetical protein
VHVELYDESLGVLELGCAPYVVTSIQIGSPAVREVIRNRALADGAFDDTRYLGARAITVGIRLNDKLLSTGCDSERPSMQTLLDRLTPYMSPRLRPTLTWQLPGSDEMRAAVVRGAQWGYSVDKPKANVITPQWIVPSGTIMAGGPDAKQCLIIRPTADENELGRVYDLTFDRVYPPSAVIGSRIIDNPGTAPSDWTLEIYGPVTDPMFTVNGVRMRTDRFGGITLTADQFLAINTHDRTVLLNGVRTESRYQFTNFDEWGWDDLVLRPGRNVVRFAGDNTGAQTAAKFCWTPNYV